MTYEQWCRIAREEGQPLSYNAYEVEEHPDCDTCKVRGLRPYHDGSKSCESGSIASGGSRSHCSCDTCF